MLRRAIPIVVVSAFLGGCTAHHKPPTQGTLADLQKVAPDVKDAETKQSVDQAMEHYRKFLDESPETPMTPEAIRRLADLELEKEYGIHTGDGKQRPMPAPESAKAPTNKPARTPIRPLRLREPAMGNPIRNLSGARLRRARSRQAAIVAPRRQK